MSLFFLASGCQPTKQADQEANNSDLLGTCRNKAVRKGKWKIISIYPSTTWELYDLENDRGETKNVAGLHPEVVREHAWEYLQWSARTGVVDYETIKPKGPQADPAPPRTTRASRESQ